MLRRFLLVESKKIIEWIYKNLANIQEITTPSDILLLNPCGESDQLIVHLKVAKNG